MGTIVPRAGIKPTSLAFRASMLTITPHRLLEVTAIRMSTSLYAAPLPERSVQMTTPLYN